MAKKTTTRSAAKLIPVTLIPGDGIGPEVFDATLTVLEAVGAPFTYDWQKAGMAGLKEAGDPPPKATLHSIRKSHPGLKGPLATPLGRGFRSFNPPLRRAFQLFANPRPGRTPTP